MPTGVLVFCLDYARKDSEPLGGVFASIRSSFAVLADTDLRERLDHVYNFRNDYIAHEKKELSDTEVARQALGDWASTLATLHAARLDR